jgi:ketosteroid isomerase-like protein
MDQGVELGRRAFRALAEGDFEALLDLMADDVVMATDPRWPGGGTYRGVEPFRQFMEQFMEAFGAVAFEETREPEGVDDATALFRGHWVGAGRASGIEAATQDFSVVVRVQDDLVAELRFFMSDRKARAHLTG